MSLRRLFNKIAPFDPDQKLILATDLSMEECARRLREQMDEDGVGFFSWSGNPRGSKAVVGLVTGCEFFLRKRLRLRNDFAPRFVGILIPSGRGTEIVGHFDADPWTKGFMRLWLGMMSFFGLMVLLAVLLEDKVEGIEVTGGPAIVLAPLAMIGFGVLMLKVMRVMFRDQEEYVIEFVKKTLAARTSSSQS